MHLHFCRARSKKCILYLRLFSEYALYIGHYEMFNLFYGQFIFRLPKDADKRKKWKEILGLDESVSTSIFVCSDHFKSKDYKMTPSGFKRLNTNALPQPYQDSIMSAVTSPKPGPSSLLRKQLTHRRSTSSSSSTTSVPTKKIESKYCSSSTSSLSNDLPVISRRKPLLPM